MVFDVYEFQDVIPLCQHIPMHALQWSIGECEATKTSPAAGLLFINHYQIRRPLIQGWIPRVIKPLQCGMWKYSYVEILKIMQTKKS